MATYDCYCYDVKSGYPLYGDYIEWQTFNSFSQRTTKRLELGYEASKNEKINLYTLFKDKIYPSIDEGNLTYEAYALKANGEADFTKPIDLSVSNNVFTYDKDMALYLKGSISGEVKSGLIIVRAKEDPTIVINDTYEHENGEIEENYLENIIVVVKFMKVVRPIIRVMRLIFQLFSMILMVRAIILIMLIIRNLIHII